MKILMLLENTFPQDERVEKEISSLIEMGHELRIATYSFKPTSFTEEYNEYIIYRKRISSLMYKFGAAILVLPFYFSFWRKYIKQIFADWEFDAIHIHDLPLAKIGHEWQKKHNILFIADQHEFYSNWIIKTAHYNTFTGRIIKKLSNWQAYERKYLGKADLVCTVEQPIKDLYLQKYRLPSDKIVVIPNTPLKSIYNKKPAARKDDAFILFYCGGLDILRGLENPIRALSSLKDNIPGIRIALVGKVNKHFDPLKLAEDLGLNEYVEFRGWADYRDLPDEIDQSDICFFTPPANRDEINNTIATKIYQYMAREKPVIVGQAKYMKEFIEKNEIGFAIDENDPDSFADAVLKIYSSEELRNKFAANAKNKMEEYYWETTVKPLTDFYAGS